MLTAILFLRPKKMYNKIIKKLRRDQSNLHEGQWINGCIWSILKKISPEYSLEGLMLKLQYFGHMMWTDDSLEKSIIIFLMLEKTEHKKRKGGRGWDGWRASLTQWTWISVNSRRWWRTGKPGLLQSMGSQRVRCDSVTEQQQQIYKVKHRTN